MSEKKIARRDVFPEDQKDPIVLYGQRHKEFRVQFWQYIVVPLLEVFADLAARGKLGKISSFSGVGRTRGGESVSFQWTKRGGLSTGAGGEVSRGGYMILHGSLDYATINRIRNFPLFHLRGGAEWLGLD